MSDRATHGRVRIGCSGWEYRHWRGEFYPADLPRDRWLSHCARRFETVEINKSFYRLPAAATVCRWQDQVPSGFYFAFKASRYLTHTRKLREPTDPLRRIVERATWLGNQLGLILFQLPPGWQRNVERLLSFIDQLPSHLSHAIEFHDPSWYDSTVFDAMAERSVALCLHDMPGSASPRVAVGPFVYVRFHGEATKYADGYPSHTLRGWADWLAEMIWTGKDVYGYFNNDVGGHAPRDALTLRRYLSTFTARAS